MTEKLRRPLQTYSLIAPFVASAAIVTAGDDLFSPGEIVVGAGPGALLKGFQSADMNGDGLIDLVFALRQDGNGRLGWAENLGGVGFGDPILSKQTLWTVMQAVLDRITPSDASNCFRHCGYSLQMG